MSRKKRKRYPGRSKSLIRLLKDYKWLVLILFLATMLRLPDLGRQALWLDEIFVYRDSRASYERIFSTMHPVTFLLGKFALNAGDHEFFLRLPSALSGILGVLFMFLLARQLFGLRTAYLAALLLTFSPFHIYYSQDANYYGEMMFFTLLATFLLFKFMNNKRVDTLLLFVLALALNYKTHPFSAFVVVSCGGVFALWMLCNREFQNLLKEKISFAARRYPVLIPIGTVVVVIGLSIPLYHLWRLFYRHTLVGAEGIKPEHFELSLRFFIRIFTDYTVAFQDYTKINQVCAIAVLCFFFFALLWGVKRKPYFSLLSFLVLVTPFVGLSMTRQSHFYHPRYTSFIVPFLLLGFAQTVSLMVEYLQQREGWPQRLAPWLAGVLLALVFFLPAAGNLVGYYRGQKQDWRSAVKFVRDHLQPGDTVAAYLWANYTCLLFYAERLGVSPDFFLKLPEVRGTYGAMVAIQEMKNLCFENPDRELYFCSSLTAGYEPKVLTKWVTKMCDVMLYRPTAPQEFRPVGKAVTLYRWRYPGHYVPPYLPLRVPLGEPSPKGPFHQEFYFDRNASYQITLQGEFSSTTSLTIDGIATLPAPHQDGFTFTAPISEGAHTLSITGMEDASPRELQIQQLPSGTLHFEAEEPDRIHPTSEKMINSYKDRIAFILKRNVFLTYDNIYISDAGEYYFRLAAVHDRPGPVVLEVRHNGRAVGILSFDKANSQWDTRGFPLSLSSGKSSFTISLLNNNTLKTDAPADQDTDAIIDYLELQRIDAQLPDNRLKLEPYLHALPSRVTNGYEGNGRLLPSWQLLPALISHTFEPAPDEGGKTALKLTIPYDSKGAIVVSLPFPVQPGKLLYFSLFLRAENLRNHSGNIRVDFVDQNDQLLAQKFVGEEGVTGHTDWLRFVCFSAVPETAAKAQILLVVYPNSRRPARTPGWVWFSPIISEQLEE